MKRLKVTYMIGDAVLVDELVASEISTQMLDKHKLVVRFPEGDGKMVTFATKEQQDAESNLTMVMYHKVFHSVITDGKRGCCNP